MQSIWLFAQVGINKTNPSATLDSGGDVLVRGKLFLENPGKYSGTDEVKMLVINSASAVTKYDIENSSFGPLNYVQYVFNNVATSGLSASGGFDTKIDAAKYTIAVHGFSFTSTSGGTSVTNRKVTGGSPPKNRTRYMEGQQFYSYVVDGTWRLRGFVNNSNFYNSATEIQINLKMDVIIYKNDFITKVHSGVISVDMNDATSGTAPLPSGF